MKRILAAFTTFALVMSLSLTSVGKVAAVTTGGGGRDDAASGRQEAPVVPDWHVNPATGHSYAQIVDLTFDLAEADALALGGHLVTINDRAEQDWLSATFTQSNLLIGLTDRATEGTWIWASGEPVTFTNWTPAEPNDANGAEDFAFMNWTDSSGNVGWNDEPEPGAVIAIIELASAGSWNVVVPDDAATIAGALALVNAGGIVHVRAGTYAGGFVIDKPMTLEGEGWGNTVIDSAGTNIGVTVQTNGAILRAFKVIATAPTIAIRFTSASNNTLDHVWTDGGRSGVSFYGGSNDNLAVDSRASNAAECGFEGGDTGSSGNTYRRVEAYGNQGGIVSYAGSDRTTVQDSKLHDNRGAGFQIGWSSGWSITGTTLTHNLNGLFIDSATSGTAFGNYISLNANHGVLLSGLGQSNDTIRGNQIHGNGAVGIRLASHSIGNVISGNVIDGNATGVLVDRNEGAPNYGNTFDHNTFTGNTVNARADEERYGGNHWDSGYPVGGNVWDDATGTDQFSGPGQDVPGPDGFLDAPRAIPGASDVDRYPFAHQAPPAGPRFTVDRGRQPAYAFIDGQQFMPGDAIAIRLNGTPLGALNADPDGNFWFNLPGDQDPPITILPGDTVAVSSGSQTKTHVVTHLQITGVEGNVISGIADTATVHLWIWDTQVDRHVAVTGGHWSVDVGAPGGPGETATTTLGPGSGISTEELDEDGDGTQADYEVPNPRFTLRPDEDSIEASGFAPNADLLVNRNGTPIDTQSTTFGPYGDAWFGSPVDLKVGDTIAVGDGTTTKTLLVSAVEISGIVGNVISGRADGDWVEVWVADTEVHRFLPVAADHTWSTDVGAPSPDPEDSATTTLVPGSGIGAQEFDGDGDATAVDTWIPNPRISVNPADGWINGVEFPIGAAVTIELNGQKVVDGSMTVDENGEIWFGPETEIRPGDTVAVSAGGVSKSTVVTHLTVDMVVGNVISGHADSVVHLWVDSTDCHRNETVGPDGAWLIDVSVPGDEEWEQMTLTLERGSSGGAEELDQDGDATQAQWHVPNPTFEADIVEDSIHGDQFGDGVVVTISDPTAGQQRSWSGAAINYDEDWFDLYLSDTDDPWDLAAGQTVTITGSNGTRTSVLADLRFTGYDLDANTVSGTTDRAGTIAVELESDQDDAPRVEVRLEAAGAWAVDFDDAGYDLRLLDAVRITQWDDVGAATSVGRTTMAPAHFLFSPVIQDVIGSDWPKGAQVTLTIERPSTTKSPDFEATTNVGIDCSNRDTCPVWFMPVTGTRSVFFNLSISPFQARPGDVMTMTSGPISKVMTIPDITVGLGQDEVLWTDEDADQTWVPAPQPDLGMDPQADRVWVSDMPTAGDVTLTVERDRVTVHTQTVHTTNVLTRGEWLLDMWTQPRGHEPRPAVALFDLGTFDLRAGDVVTVTDGADPPIVKIVPGLTVDSIDPVTDTVSGTADPGVHVDLHLGEGVEGFWGYSTIADAGGHWTFHFDPDQFPNQGLEPGMLGEAIIDHSTIVFWTVAEGGVGNVTVTADDLTVDYGAALPALTWHAAGLHSGDVWTTEPECTTTAIVGSPVGTYPISCAGAVAEGYTVDYVEGALTVVPAAQSIDFAPLADQTIGTPPVVLNATATSGLDVSFTSSTPTVCTIGGRNADRLTLVAVGTCTVVSAQAGDANHLAAPTVERSFSVNKMASSVVVTSDRATASPGQAVRLTATVVIAKGQPTGTVTFTDGSTTLGIAPLGAGGKATLSISTFAIGTHDISAVFAETATITGSTGVLPGGVTVSLAASTVTIANARDLEKKSSRLGQAYVVKVQVAAVVGGIAKPTGTITISDGTASCSAVLAANGTNSCSLTPTTAGAFTITATYDGDATYAGSTTTVIHPVVP